MLMGGHGVISVTANVAPRADVARCAGRRSPASSRTHASSTTACCRCIAGCSSSRTRSRSSGRWRRWGRSERAAAAAGSAVFAIQRHAPLRAARGRLSFMTHGNPMDAGTFAFCSRPHAALFALRATLVVDAPRRLRNVRPAEPRQAHRLQVHRDAHPHSRSRPDLNTPRFDDRFSHDGERARRAAGGPPASSRICCRQNADARIVRAGTERWLVVKAHARADLVDGAPVLERPGLRRRGRAAHDRRDGNRLGREPRRDPDGSGAPDDRQVHRHPLHDVQARQVPHARRARHRARHDGDLPVASRHGAGADGQDRRLARRRHSRGPCCRRIRTSKRRCWRG